MQSYYVLLLSSLHFSSIPFTCHPMSAFVTCCPLVCPFWGMFFSWFTKKRPRISLNCLRVFFKTPPRINFDFCPVVRRPAAVCRCGRAHCFTLSILLLYLYSYGKSSFFQEARAQLHFTKWSPVRRWCQFYPKEDPRRLKSLSILTSPCKIQVPYDQLQSNQEKLLLLI